MGHIESELEYLHIRAEMKKNEQSHYLCRRTVVCVCIIGVLERFSIVYFLSDGLYVIAPIKICIKVLALCSLLTLSISFHRVIVISSKSADSNKFL